MGNCLPCTKRGGRRRRGRRGRSNRVAPGQGSNPTPASNVHDVPGNAPSSPTNTQRPVSREEATMERELNYRGRQDVEKGISYVIGFNNETEQPEPKLANILNIINDDLDSAKAGAAEKKVVVEKVKKTKKRVKQLPELRTCQSVPAQSNTAQSLNHHAPAEVSYTKEEDSLMDSIVETHDTLVKKEEMTAKVEAANARRERLLQKRSKKAKHLATRDVSDEAVPSTSDVTEAVKTEEAQSVVSYTKEEDSLMDSIVETHDTLAKKEEMTAKMEAANARRERLLQKRSKKAKHLATRDVSEEAVPSTSDVAEAVKAEEAQSVISYTKEEDSLMDSIVETHDTQVKKEEMTAKMEAANARRERLLQKRSKKAKHLATRDVSDVAVPSTSDVAEAVKAEEAQAVVSYTKEEDSLMDSIVETHDTQVKKEEMTTKMEAANARREKLLQKRSKKAKHLATRDDSDKAVPSTSDVAEAVKAEEAQSVVSYTKEEDSLMDSIMETHDTLVKKEEMTAKMDAANARRERLLQKRSKKAKHLATRDVSDEAVPSTSGVTEAVKAEEAQSVVLYSKEEQALMQAITETDDARERREAHERKMARAEARRQRALARKAKKAKSMATSGAHAHDPEPTTSTATGRHFGAPTTSLSEVLKEIMGQDDWDEDEDEVILVTTKFSTEEEELMAEIMENFGDCQVSPHRGSERGREGEG